MSCAGRYQQRCRSLQLVVACALVCCAGGDRRVVTPTPGGPRIDSAGVPLPPGALLRLGGARWRHGAAKVAFSPDRRTLASAGNGIRIWDVASGRMLRQLPQRAVVDIAYAPDGHALAAVSDKTVHLWRLRTGVHMLIAKHRSPITAVSFAADGKRVASGSSDGAILVWDATTRGQYALRHRKRVTDLAFAPRGTLLASASEDKTVRLWRGRHQLRRFQTDCVALQAIAFSPDGSQVAASGFCSERILRWDVASGRALAGIAPTFGVLVKAVAFSPDRRLVAFGGDRIFWIVRDLKTAIIRRFADERFADLAFSPAGDRLAVAHGYVIDLYDVRRGVPQRRPNRASHRQRVLAVAYSRDGERLASASQDGTVRVWHGRTGALLSTLAHPKAGALTFGAHGRWLASAGGDALRVWDLAAGRPRVLGRRVQLVALSPDGGTLATMSARGLALWDTSSWRRRASKARCSRGVGAISFAGDQLLALACADGTVRTWDLHADKPLKTLRGHQQPVSAVSGSPDGKRLASGSWDGTIRIWDAAKGSCHAVIEVGSDVLSLAFRADGEALAAGSLDRRVILFKRTRRLVLPTAGRTAQAPIAWTAVRSYRGHTGRIHDVAFAPDGRSVASASGDASVIVWRAPR